MGRNSDFLLKEHEKFNKYSSEICASDLHCRSYFDEMNKVKKRHQRMEEEIVFPLYCIVEDKSSIKDPKVLEELNSSYDIYFKFYDRLIEDHNVIKKILKEVRGQTYRIEVVDAIDEMIDHMEMEEEFVYPSVSKFPDVIADQFSHD